MSARERYVVTRSIAATPDAIFAVLADPSRHQDIEPGGWTWRYHLTPNGDGTDPPASRPR